MSDHVTHALDGKRLTYTYDELGTVRLELRGGALSFEWIAGPFKGEAGKGFRYQAKQIGENQFFMNWHEPEARSFVTLYLDLDRKLACSSVLAGYATSQEQTLFDSARINCIEEL